jgi:uncharacterized protein
MPRRLVITLVVLALGAGACVRTTVAPPSRGAGVPGMVVSGLGTVEVRPDTLVVSLGVTSERPTPTEALDAVSHGARALVAAVTSAGLPRPDVRTESLSVRPTFDEHGNIASYVGSEMFRIEIRNLDRAGAIVGKAADAVGEDIRVGGMTLEVADKERVLRQARERAVADALARAKELTDAAGLDLCDPVSVAEGPASRFPVFRVPVATSVAGGAGVASGGSSSTAGTSAGAVSIANLAPRIEPGTQEVQVRVRVKFLLGGTSR